MADGSDHTIARPDGRTVGFAVHGADGASKALLWCHGGPGSRFEAAPFASALVPAGWRVVCVDRPGYGLSSPMPGRSIADWVPDAVAVLDALGIATCVVVGVSTGGAYALAVAANAPQRVDAVLVACGVTDLRWAAGKAMLRTPLNAAVWDAGDRSDALAAARAVMGDDGAGMAAVASSGAPLPPADLAVLAGMGMGDTASPSHLAMFAHGVQGYVDDRRADGVGWGSFDVTHVSCPVLVLHGDADSIVPVAHARWTAAIVPAARLRIAPALGHLSIGADLGGALAQLLR